MPTSISHDSVPARGKQGGGASGEGAGEVVSRLENKPIKTYRPANDRNSLHRSLPGN